MNNEAEQFEHEQQQQQLCGEYEMYTLARFLFLSLSSVLALFGAGANLALFVLFSSRVSLERANTPATLYPRVLALLDASICAGYILLFGADAAVIYLRIRPLFLLYHLYIVPAFVLSRICQLAIPYMLIFATLERLVWISSGKMRNSLLRRMYSVRGRQITVGFTLGTCALLRLPTYWATTVHEYPQIRRRLRLFEVRDRNSFPTTPAALPPAKILLLSSLSHNGVPVHPLQFQRFLRSEEVDDGSVVVLYDVQSSQQLWAHYALWIFRLFGLDNSLLLMGGPNWTVNGTSLITLLKGLNVPPNVSPPGHSPVGIFQAQWRAEFIATFDDVLANFEGDNAASANAADIVDAQTEKEFDGRAPSVPGPASSASGAIFGHIRGAKSVPVETLGGLSPEGQRTLFHAQFGLSPARPIIVYDGFSSHRAAFVWTAAATREFQRGIDFGAWRAAFVWTALRRANFSAELYFGAWPEWLVRAPDHLKVIPDN
uniref:Rhodanese domain-containing protein n=1 Tax=Globodera pallida TaxID=36090 RepID=A0A183BRS5_GLOPA